MIAGGVPISSAKPQVAAETFVLNLHEWISAAGFLAAAVDPNLTSIT
jgi:hypothetical protein